MIAASLDLKYRRWLWTLLILALVLRLGFGLLQDPRLESMEGSDSQWYWHSAAVLLSGETTGTIDGQLYSVASLSTPPIYFIVIGLPQGFLSAEAAVIAVRLFQAFLSTLTVYCAYRLAWRISRRKPAGLLAAALIALSPAFIIESAQITTETVFMALLAGGLTLFVEAVYRGGAAHQAPTWWLGAAVLLGLASLTRAVLILFPFALAAYWLIAPMPSAPDRRFARRVGWALAFGAVYLAVVLTWTGYNWIRWNRLVFGGGDISAFLYIGATGWADPQEVDRRLEAQAGSGDPNVRNYAQGAASTIASDPLAYVKRRLTEWSGSILQPHGTVFFGGESLRDLGVHWLTEDRSLNGLVEVLRGDAFGSKLVIYVFHYTALFFGLIGMWRVRRAWPLTLPLLAYIGYTAALHLVILALPRYWFPTMIFWTVFAACAFFGVVRKEQTA